ncbi:hypothetical protein DAI22_01g073208 [Oryza sativa Japonica Group]|nr:hypothetical protein DAI22_01g073208 [Oryza sativa Japonica Group]
MPRPEATSMRVSGSLRSLLLHYTARGGHGPPGITWWQLAKKPTSRVARTNRRPSVRRGVGWGWAPGPHAHVHAARRPVTAFRCPSPPFPRHLHVGPTIHHVSTPPQPAEHEHGGSSRVPLVGPTAHGCPRAASLTWTEPRGVGPTPAEGERHASWGVPPTHTLVASGVGWWCEMTRLPLAGLEQTRRRGGGMRVNKRRSRGNTVARQPPVLCQSSRHCGLHYPPTTSSPSSASASA